MDFLNKLSAKAGETFQTIKESDATKKAKNYAEIPGLSLQVGKQEGIVKKAYQEIGEAYYLAHKDDVDSIYGEQMQTITKALAKIEELKTEIENKKEGSFRRSKERRRAARSRRRSCRSIHSRRTGSGRNY